MQNELIGGKFRIIRKIGSGSFGSIYLGENTENLKQVALKFEAQSDTFQLLKECRIYRRLANSVGFGSVYWYGTHNEQSVMAIDLLGKSLEQHIKSIGKFSLKTTLMIADQAISRLEFLHKKGFVHRDIKPANFLLGRGASDRIIHLVDFGLSVPYFNPETNKHIEYSEELQVAGTARYSAVNTHLGIVPSRRDDLESLSYVLIYFLKGSLPWQGLKAASFEEKMTEITKVKMQTSTEVLCKDLPSELALFVDQVRSLRYDDEPDYAFYRKIFRNLFIKEQFVFDDIYDWNLY